MTRDDTAWISDLFASCARDWTPAFARNEACVLYAPFVRNPEASRRCGSVLSESERQRAERFVTEDGRVHFKQRRAFRRYCGAVALGSSRPLSELVFGETDTGQPYLADALDVWFSFSSCRFGFLGAWSSTHAIGIDIEDQTRSLEAAELAHRYFSTAEAKAVEEANGLGRRRAFLRLWSLKEAALKSIGEGLPFGLDAFEFNLTPNLYMVHAPRVHGGPERFDAQVFEASDICAALVIRSLA
jgi:phosphopantetheine--protein transferase-like protein